MPFSDEYLIFKDGRYFLTEAALIRMGIDLRERLAASKAITPEYTISTILEMVTDTIYEYIHKFNSDNDAQDRTIAYCAGMRKIIQKALEHQAYYLISLGDQAMTLDDNKIRHMVSPHAKNALERNIPELGVPIVYIGEWQWMF